MKDSTSPSKASKNESAGKPFKQLTRKQKFVFVSKVVVCICTFGFVFPNLM